MGCSTSPTGWWPSVGPAASPATRDRVRGSSDGYRSSDARPRRSARTRTSASPDATSCSQTRSTVHPSSTATDRAGSSWNVYALTYNNRASTSAYQRLLKEIDEAGYSCTAKVLNAADHGVPQARPRLFVIGAPKGERQPEHPEATHGGAWERRQTGSAERPHITSGQALEGLVTTPEPEEVLRGQYGHLLADIPPGENYLHYTAERGHPQPLFEWRSRYWSFLLKLDPDRPSPTIQAQPGSNVGPFHWQNRRLRVPEVKRLFTFPDDFEVVGSRGSAQAQLGNCVPPELARRVAEAVKG